MSLFNQMKLISNTITYTTVLDHIKYWKYNDDTEYLGVSNYGSNFFKTTDSPLPDSKDFDNGLYWYQDYGSKFIKIIVGTHIIRFEGYSDVGDLVIVGDYKDDDISNYYEPYTLRRSEFIIESVGSSSNIISNHINDLNAHSDEGNTTYIDRSSTDVRLDDSYYNSSYSYQPIIVSKLRLTGGQSLLGMPGKVVTITYPNNTIDLVNTGDDYTFRSGNYSLTLKDGTIVEVGGKTISPILGDLVVNYANNS